MSVADAHHSFRRDITALFLLDQRTQSQNPRLALSQLATINEAIFVRAFRAYENLLESIFLDYVQGEKTLGGVDVVSYLRPRDAAHAYEMVRSSQPFLEWNSPSTVLARSETYLDSGGPIKTVLAAKQSLLQDFRRIRNHIAHNSRTSTEEYKKVVQRHLTTLPLVLPNAGEFLQLNKRERTLSPRTFLRYALDELAEIGDALVA